MFNCLIGLTLLLVTGTASAEPIKKVISCRLSDGSEASLLAESNIDGEQLYLEMDRQTMKAFSDMPNTDFIGQIVLAKCVDSVLVFALNYGTPYLKGAAVRKNPKNHMTERISFEKKRCLAGSMSASRK